MIERSFSPSASICLLRETGELVDADNAPRAASPIGPVLVSRALCRFAFFPRPAAVTKGEAERAALLHAEAHAPFVDSDFAVFGAPSGFGVWWWDAARTRELIGAAAPYQSRRLAPETVAHAPGEDWRQVRTADGYDAQYWEGSSLRASRWRRQPFDVAQWRAFAGSVVDAASPAPEAPPKPILPAWAPTHAWSRARVTRTSVWPVIERTAWSAAAAALVISVGVFGHASKLRREAEGHRAAIAALAEDASRTARDVALVRAVAGSTTAPEHLIAVADLVAALEAEGLDPVSWESDERRVRAQATGEAELGRLGAALEDNPRLRNVAPLRDDGAVVVTAEVERSNAPLAEGAP